MQYIFEISFLRIVFLQAVLSAGKVRLDTYIYFIVQSNEFVHSNSTRDFLHMIGLANNYILKHTSSNYCVLT